jgi:hypothetical protein
VPKSVHESTLPPVLDVEGMAALLGISVRGVYYAMKRPGWLFPPMPGIDSRPHWPRDQVLAILATYASPVASRLRRV